uniref:Uncharacterized protein n=1 Tax=uncultured marine virus TaxID=186617 RepID=A0A0F7L3M4_9VIRU|nr:hypothetical protein [uncultured marine virus]
MLSYLPVKALLLARAIIASNVLVKSSFLVIKIKSFTDCFFHKNNKLFFKFIQNNVLAPHSSNVFG